MGTSTAVPIPYLLGVRVKTERIESNDYPFNLPLVRALDLQFSSPVTFFVGENGTGKSTVIEAICRAVPAAGLRWEPKRARGQPWAGRGKPTRAGADTSRLVPVRRARIGIVSSTPARAPCAYGCPGLDGKGAVHRCHALSDSADLSRRPDTEL